LGVPEYVLQTPQLIKYVSRSNTRRTGGKTLHVTEVVVINLVVLCLMHMVD